jgi:hypothetical protein
MLESGEMILTFQADASVWVPSGMLETPPYRTLVKRHFYVGCTRDSEAGRSEI